MRTANPVYDCTCPVADITLHRARVTTIRSAATAALLCLGLAGAPSAFGQAPDTVFLEDLTWTELRDAGPRRQDDDHRARSAAPSRTGRTWRSASTTCASGACPNDRARARQRAGRAGDRLRAGRRARPADRPHALPGTITVPDDAFQKVLESAARSFELHGFRDIVFLGDHGSTQAGQKAVAARLNREWAGAAGARARDRGVLPGERGRFAAAARARAAISRGRARHARRARRHVADAGPRSARWCARTACVTARLGAGGRGGRRPEPGERRARAARRRADRERGRSTRSGSPSRIADDARRPAAIDSR